MSELELENLVKVQMDALGQLNKELTNFKKDGPNRRTKHHFKTRLDRIHASRLAFVTNHRQIIQITGSSTDTYTTEDIYSEFEEVYVDTVAQIQTEFDIIHPSDADQSVTEVNSTINPHVTYQLSAPSPSPFKLPEFVIPTFDGIYTEWPTFHDSFLQVHKNKRVSINQKFQLLKNSLSKKVKSLIGYLDITEENYETAWKALIERYNNKRVLFSNYIESFINQPVIVSENAEELQTLHDFSRANVFALNRLGIKTDECGEILAHLIIKKLPYSLRLDWEKELGKSIDIPKFKQVIDFIEIRFRTLEAVNPQASITQSHSKSSFQSPHKATRKETKSFHVQAKIFSCPLCEQSHVLRKCATFKKMTPQSRKSCADKLKLCINCLGHSTTQACTSTKTCFTCNGRHHTMLHFNKPSPSISNASNSNSITTNNEIVPLNTEQIQISANNVVETTSSVLLTTALIDIPDIDGQFQRFRALVDHGSQQSIVTERAAQRLRLPITSICVGVRPMSESQYKIVNRGLNLAIHAHFDQQHTVDGIFAIMPTITSNLPLFPLRTKTWPHIQSLPLADPQFATPGPIDILLAGDVYYKILQSGLCKGQSGEPVATNTSLGWILGGEVALQTHIPVFTCCHVSTIDIGMYIKKFYESEEISNEREITDEDKWTVDHFNRTYTRLPNGRFQLRLPFKSEFNDSMQLGSSYSRALKRFQSLERRFDRDPKFHADYINVIDEYKQLNQIKLVETINNFFVESKPIKHYYLPHHAVIKASSLTTQMRTVFDGSAKTSNGKSLNDILTTGPTLQAGLVSIILNWRTHKFVFIADIAKMYRCIDIHPDDTKYQQILWKNERSQLQSYALQTVTFGIKSSPYMAIQTTHKLAELERETYPLAYTAIKNETYVDDITSGGESIEQTIALTNQLIQMLRGAHFELRKWASNSPEILTHIPTEYHDRNTTCLLNTIDEIKALGLCWSAQHDYFQFSINFALNQSTHTKRTTLSMIARLFDPLGWLNPFVTRAKLFLNKLWEQNLGWDDVMSSELSVECEEIINQFQFLDQIKIPRYIHTSSTDIQRQIHVFCDSTLRAYSTSIYLRTVDQNNEIYVHLMIAKSKLTPIRHPLTIPRAELSGAVLAVKLLESIKSNFRLPTDEIHIWSDSSVVLSWIRGDPNRWAPFVSNRIHRILSSTEISQWRHVVSKDNPADCNCRGLTIEQLRDSSLWWEGPKWLSLPQNQWSISNFDLISDDHSELRAKFKAVNVVTNELPRLDSILLRFSNFNRLRRSFAYFLRYISILRANVQQKKAKPTLSIKPIHEQIASISPLTVKEIENAENAIIRWIQHEHFTSEIKSLSTEKSISHTSKLKRLNPFIDENQMLRVNGRLRNAFMSYNEKYPLIIPSKHTIVPLIARFYHNLAAHAGPQLTVNLIRQTYWILNIRTFIRHFIHRCVRCFKLKPILSNQFMGSLPKPRVNDKSAPFAATMIDYAGPYDIRASKGRGQSSYKGYVAVFTCMATKATHLEAVGDLTAQSFIHALDRFIARRGLCSDIYSDNGTNFVGAANQINRQEKDFQETIVQNVIPYLTTKNIQWHFSPPGAPNFNGLVEAAVKSMKFHFMRIIDTTKLTFEEFSTVLARIEAILNSRPISPTSDNPNDFTALTPGHFLIGRPLLSRPEPPIDEIPTKRHQLMQTMVQHFWQRFKNDILSSMQIRTKWQTQQPNLKINDLVIVKDERFPINHWPVARVVAVHPGDDEIIRVVTVKTAHGMYKRPISKLGLIPIQNNK